MDVLFSESSVIPLPRDEVRILDLKVNPYPDGQRIHVIIELTPFIEKPNGDVVVMDKDGHKVADTCFIETVIPKFEMTLHLPQGVRSDGEYSIGVTIFYTNEITGEDQDKRVTQMPEKIVVDQREVSLHLDEEHE
jgi:hypothetical protein